MEGSENSVASMAAALQRHEDLARGDELRGHAELRQDERAEAGDAHAQALQVVDRVDLLAEPAAGLGIHEVARQDDHVVRVIGLLDDLEAAAAEHPGEQDLGRGAEGMALTRLVTGIWLAQ